ncbi:MAG: YicC family protein [Peptococcaceae bacterium]|nr:YicC family protein [Peptococcaceae bacterium]
MDNGQLTIDKGTTKAAVSMTGFGVGRAVGEGYSLAAEIKSVNHRFLEIVVHLPREWAILEDEVKKLVRQAARRGRVEVSVAVQPGQKKRKRVVLDKELALEYDSRLKELASFLAKGAHGLIGSKDYCPDIGFLASCPDVLFLEPSEVDAGTLWPVLKEALDQAAGQFVRMRETEGQELTRDLLSKSGELGECLAVIAGRAEGAADTYRERLETRLKLALGEDFLLSDPRVTQELVLAADRMSIEEEVVRLKSHIGQFADALGCGEAVGRRLDFLVQEMNRELNTIGAKGGDLIIAQQVIQAKGLAENLKEQALNLE